MSKENPRNYFLSLLSIFIGLFSIGMGYYLKSIGFIDIDGQEDFFYNLGCFIVSLGISIGFLRYSLWEYENKEGLIWNEQRSK